MKVQHIIGADLSKKSIDLVCHLQRTHIQIENSIVGFKNLLQWLKQLKINASKTMIVMEHTGLYSYCFEKFLHQHQVAFCKVSALEIKRSMGLVRGKTDKVDAARIAAYGYQKKDKLSVDVPASDVLKRLQMLHSVRHRLVRQRAALTCAIKEYRHIGIPEKDILMQTQLQLIKNFDKQIEKLMAEIESIVNKQESLKQNFQLLQSIPGVGKIVALVAIIKTHNFTRFGNARKFACFCGTAPFPHESGSSIKKRTRISHLADKQMKSLLDLSSKVAIQHDQELREYYLKRTEGGKSKMSTINVVRNKILYRMFAVIKRQTPFVENYLKAA
ncbi:MAG TPA: IS110 family transposase [Chitinophagaceae bacterium]|jgi:transposase|nr:IS110 family transposase [Chitinophagaceae bacterium]